MGAAIWFFALFPLYLGHHDWRCVQNIGDESLLLLYLAVFPFLYLFTERLWRHGFDTLYRCLLVVFVFAQALPFTVAKDLVAWRNFCETYCSGRASLCSLSAGVVQQRRGACCHIRLSGVTLPVALMTIVERIVQRNPIMEHGWMLLSFTRNRADHRGHLPAVHHLLSPIRGRNFYGARGSLCRSQVGPAQILVLIACVADSRRPILCK